MVESQYFPFDVKWSSQLEKLADGLFVSWQDAVRNAADPFGKVCVVVNDSATENWLKQYFLLDKKIPQVMMNLEFVKLPEFINDWLSSELYGIEPWQRQASKHPYSTGVLTWRIYHILTRADRNGELKDLLDYIGEDRKHLRCLALSEKLAVLYDDYLNSRSQLLRNWEKGKRMPEQDVPDWQIRLYQILASEDKQTYAADYEKIFSAGADAKIAFEYGFPRYLAVHVFDIPFMPETTLHLLEKISEAFPGKMTFWHFNPHSEWLGETGAKKEMLRKIREDFRQQRNLLHEGASLSCENVSSVLDAAYDSPEERLFGALASGARAMICNLCKDSDGRVDAAGDLEALQELKRKKVFLHKCYSPRRELEAIKDGLLHFFKEHQGVRPHDAVVLCADWENYAPVIESVFRSSPNSEGYIPVTVAGKTPGESPFLQSFRKLLSFRENRFEADAVFTLLENPAICKKYELEESDLDVLRDMIGKANIRWGCDDADVRQTLEIETDSTVYPFTWQRGLDRMASEFLYGFNEDGCALLKAGVIGELRPCGFVEGERAKTLASLWQLVQNLKWLRGIFAPDMESSPDEIQQNLLEVIRRFYDESDETILKEANQTRQTIRSTAESMKFAGINPICTEVFLASVLTSLSGSVPGMRTAGDSVQFAPLNCSSAVPHQLVWICGLNDGAFPKVSYRASYDLIGKHPSFFDATPREKDSFALLKAVLSARKQLCFSYVGKDNHTNDDFPPSVLLTDLKNYFTAAGISCTEYEHPMNAYSPRYFMTDQKKPLPPAYSDANYEIAKMLQKDETKTGTVPFPLSHDSLTKIELNDLADFFAGPNRYLFRTKEIYVSESRFNQISSKENLSARLDKKLQEDLVLTGECAPLSALLQVESGNAPDAAAAEAKIEEIRKGYNKALSGDYHALQEVPEEDAEVELNADHCKVSIHMQYSVLRKGEQKSMLFYENYPDSDSTKNKIRLRYLGANAAEGGVSAVAFGAGTAVVFPELSRDQAKEILSAIIRKSHTPLPFEFPDYRKTGPKEDVLPPDWQNLLNELLPCK